MVKNKSAVIVFTLIFSLVLLFFMFTDTNIVDDLSYTQFKYSDSDSSLEIESLFDQEEVVKYAFRLFTESSVLNAGLDEDFILTLAAEKDYRADELYEAYRNFSILIDSYSENDVVDDYASLLKVLPDSKMNMNARWIEILESVDYIGGFDAYFITDFNSYDYQGTTKVFTNKKKNYRIIYTENESGTVLYLDEAIDLSIEYAYVFNNNEFSKRIKVSSNHLEQKIYEQFSLMMMENQTRIDFPYNDTDMLLIKK